MLSEENLQMLRACGASYLVGPPKSMLKKFEHHLLEQAWPEAVSGVQVKLCPAPDGVGETFVLCRSPLRREKERAIRERQIKGLTQGLEKLKASAQSGAALRSRQSRTTRGPVVSDLLARRRPVRS